MRWYKVIGICSVMIFAVILLDYFRTPEIVHRYSTKGSDVLIFAYMRGGSTLIGEVLGHRNDTMYFYEPLFRVDEFYFTTRFQRCSLKRKHCETNITHSNKVINIMNSLYKCDIDGEWDNLPVRLMTYKGGETWKKILSTDIEFYCQRMQEACKKSKIKVIKVLRLGMDSVEDIIIKNPGLKIIFLLRDPRAVIHSRQNVHFNRDDIEDTFQLASSVCNKMALDYEVKQRLELKYPDTFFTLYYEEYANSMLYWTYRLFRFLGHQERNVLKHLNRFIGTVRSEEHPLNTKRTDPYEAANRWRQTIKLTDVMIIENICRSAIDRLGYLRFQNLTYLRNTFYSLVSRKQQN